MNKIIFGGRKRKSWYDRNQLLIITILQICCVLLILFGLSLLALWAMAEPTGP